MRLAGESQAYRRYLSDFHVGVWALLALEYGGLFLLRYHQLPALVWAS